MPNNTSKFNALFKELASTNIHEHVKSFISDLYNQLGTLQTSYFKQEHRDEFIKIRSQCRDLINQTRDFCDKAIPSIEYAVAQYNAPEPVNVKILAEKVLSRVNPKNVLDQCHTLENMILTFNDRIAIDEYYIKDNTKLFLCTGFGAALAIVSLVGLFFAPVVLEAELAVFMSGSLASNVTISSINLFSDGLTKIRTEKNFTRCKENMVEASKYVIQLKEELSNITQNHGHLEIRLDLEDVQGLKPIYENLLKNMKDIRELCLKPFPTI